MTLVAWICFFILLAVFFNIAINIFCMPRLTSRRPPDTDETTWPLISILVPARNEEENIRRCIDSLLNQNYPNFELIVLDDQSEDKTFSILEKIKSEHPRAGRLIVIRGQSLPEEWIGKCWACHQLAREAKGEWLLFTDADTHHDPGTLTAAFALADDERADLTSLWPRQITETMDEQLVVPLVQLILIGYCPLWLLNKVQSPRMVAACGQFMLWRRESYIKLGGHEAVCTDLVEDVALAGRVLKEKMRLINADATEIISTRMYRGFEELWKGFTKNFYTGFGGHPVPFFIFLAIQALPFLLPWVFCVVSAARWHAPNDPALSGGFWILPFVIQHMLFFTTILLGYLVSAVPAIRYKQTGLSALLYPVSEILLLLIGINSFLKTTSREGVEWKGRSIARPNTPFVS